MIRHIQECARCRTRKKQGIDTLAMLRMLPVAQLPGSLRHSVLTDGFDSRLESFRDGLGRHAKPFNGAGFPISHERRRRRAMALPTAVAAAAVVTGVALSASMLLPDSHTATLASPQAPTSSAPTPGAQPGGSPATSPTTSASPNPSNSPMAAVAGTNQAQPVTAPRPTHRPGRSTPPVSHPPSKPPHTPAVTLHASTGALKVPMKDGVGSATFTLSASNGAVLLGALTSSNAAVSAQASASRVDADAPVTVTVAVKSTITGTATINVPWSSGGATGVALTIEVTWPATAADPSPSTTPTDN